MEGCCDARQSPAYLLPYVGPGWSRRFRWPRCWTWAPRGSSMRWRTSKSTPHCRSISHTCRTSTSARPLRRAERVAVAVCFCFGGRWRCGVGGRRRFLFRAGGGASQLWWWCRRRRPRRPRLFLLWGTEGASQLWWWCRRRRPRRLFLLWGTGRVSFGGGVVAVVLVVLVCARLYSVQTGLAQTMSKCPGGNVV